MSGHREDLVSVIVPVYNVSAYLEECIRSICGQTYQNLEIILVDDGSTDGSGEICDRFAKKDERILVRHQENEGLSAARNAGLNLSHGKYLSFVDADDVVHRCYVEILYHLCRAESCKISCCGYQTFSQAVFTDQEDNDARIAGVEVLERKSALSKLNKWRCVEATAMVIVCNKMYKREIWREIRFPVGTWHEDEFIIHHVLGSTDRIAVTRRALYGYRKHKGSYMSIDDPTINFSHLALHRALIDRIRFYSVEEPDLVNGAVHHLLRESHSFYDIFLKDPTEESKRARKELVHQYRTVYWEYYEYIKRKEKIAGMLFAYLPSVYHAIVYCKWNIQEIRRKNTKSV